MRLILEVNLGAIPQETDMRFQVFGALKSSGGNTNYIPPEIIGKPIINSRIWRCSLT